MSVWRPAFFPRHSRSSRSGPRRTSPPRLLIEGFLILIIIGSCLLKTPWATYTSITWLEAAFTATSAVTVTGLVVVDTGSQFTLFGQLVILTLIQFGGLGLMTFAVLTAVALGFRFGLKQQLVAQEALNEISIKTTRKAGASIAVFALISEAIGLLVLACFFVPEKGWLDGLYHALFYAISAFNNAGFGLSPNSLIAYVSSPGITLTVSALFIVGGLGYLVVKEILEKRSFSALSVYSKLILVSTLILNVTATAIFLLLEYGNPNTLGALGGFGNKLLAAWFQSTTPRTAGFNTLEISTLTQGTCVMFLLLMFIGGAPNSTTSGIKLTTFVILIAATRSFLRGNINATLFKRSLTREAIIKALAITTLAMATIFLGVFGLAVSTDSGFLDLSFEVVSAFGTVGLSRGTTGELNAAGQLIIMLVMLIGRVGPLTLGYILTMRSKSHVRYAKTEFPVG